MSYCRWGDGDIYCYRSSDGWQVFVANNERFQDVKFSYQCDTARECAKLLKYLQSKGVDVQEYAIEEIEEESEDEYDE